MRVVSVPIRGLFNLTLYLMGKHRKLRMLKVSVPIRGLFNLTCITVFVNEFGLGRWFPSPSGDYLI